MHGQWNGKFWAPKIVLALSLFFLKKVATQPKSCEVSQTRGRQFVKFQWDCRIRRTFGDVVFFQPMRLQDLSYFQGCRYFQPMRLHDLSYFGGRRYFEPMELQYCTNFEDDVFFNQWNCIIGRVKIHKLADERLWKFTNSRYSLQTQPHGDVHFRNGDLQTSEQSRNF